MILEEKIRAWLEAQGYPLEMRVARQFRSRGFRVVQSEFYKDGESGLLRETDVVASAQSEADGVLIRVSFVVECKTSPDKPWVLFTAASLLAEPARIAQRAATALCHQILEAIAKQDSAQKIPMFVIHERAAHGLTRAFSSGADQTYEAAVSVAKASVATVTEADHWADKTKHDVCEVAIPIIVVGGQMFEVYLQADGETVIQRIDAGTLLWRNPIVGMPHTIIRIVTENGLEAFVDDAAASADSFLRIAKAELSRIHRGKSGTV
jgi:hypothetical protein